jgi:hypothetical protein
MHPSACLSFVKKSQTKPPLRQDLALQVLMFAGRAPSHFGTISCRKAAFRGNVLCVSAAAGDACFQFLTAEIDRKRSTR